MVPAPGRVGKRQARLRRVKRLSRHAGAFVGDHVLCIVKALAALRLAAEPAVKRLCISAMAASGGAQILFANRIADADEHRARISEADLLLVMRGVRISKACCEWFARSCPDGRYARLVAIAAVARYIAASIKSWGRRPDANLPSPGKVAPPRTEGCGRSGNQAEPRLHFRATRPSASVPAVAEEVARADPHCR